MKTILQATLALPLALVLLTSCQDADVGSQSAATAGQEEMEAPAASVEIARIVFIDKEHACACTREKIEASWRALKEALPPDHLIEIQTLHLDTQADLAAPFRRQRPLVAVPALYFLDDEDTIIDLLQGKLTAEQIGKVLAKGQT